MSTRGFIGIKHDGKIVGMYNHSSSYPTYLGVRSAEFIQRENLSEITKKVDTLVPVDESKDPTPEQLADLKARGFWSNVSTGKDWYSALRNAQGDLAAYIKAGYYPTFDVAGTIEKGDCYIEWGYVIDLDEQVLSVYEYETEAGPMPRVGIIPFDTITAPGFDAASVMGQIEQAAN